MWSLPISTREVAVILEANMLLFAWFINKNKPRYILGYLCTVLPIRLL